MKNLYTEVPQRDPSVSVIKQYFFGFPKQPIGAFPQKRIPINVKQGASE